MDDLSTMAEVLLRLVYDYERLQRLEADLIAAGRAHSGTVGLEPRMTADAIRVAIRAAIYELDRRFKPQSEL